MKRAEHSVRFLPVAEEDLSNIVLYVAAEKPQAAVKLAGRFEAMFESLGRHSRMGRVPDDPHLHSLGYRFITLDNYLVFYVVEGRNVVIHRIIHGVRDYAVLL